MDSAPVCGKITVSYKTWIRGRITLGVRGNGQRIFIIVIVVVFFLTAVATTAGVVYDAVKNKDNNSLTNTTNQQTAETPQIPTQEGKLEGTKLTGFTPIDTVAKLEVIDLVPGTGAAVAQGATVTAHYTGALAKDGTIFQSSKDTGQPFTAPLSNVIPGWQEGMVGMKVGGTRRIVIPAEQAYGAQATGNIPANSDLVFDIELIDTK